jgi:F-type H+-transporting ATPase subunit epsilon
VNTFPMHLESTTQYEQVANVISFIGEDESGSFGVLPGHARMMTLLRFGLARFRVLGEDWEYLALPGALAYFLNGELHLSTRHYLRGKDYDRISTGLEQELLVEEDNLQVVKQSLHRLEEEMFKRLWKLKRTGEAL